MSTVEYGICFSVSSKEALVFASIRPLTALAMYDFTLGFRNDCTFSNVVPEDESISSSKPGAAEIMMSLGGDF